MYRRAILKDWFPLSITRYVAAISFILPDWGIFHAAGRFTSPVGLITLWLAWQADWSLSCIQHLALTDRGSPPLEHYAISNLYDKLWQGAVNWSCKWQEDTTPTLMYELRHSSVRTPTDERKIYNPPRSTTSLSCIIVHRIEMPLAWPTHCPCLSLMLRAITAGACDHYESSLESFIE